MFNYVMFKMNMPYTSRKLKVYQASPFQIFKKESLTNNKGGMFTSICEYNYYGPKYAVIINHTCVHPLRDFNIIDRRTSMTFGDNANCTKRVDDTSYWKMNSCGHADVPLQQKHLDDETDILSGEQYNTWWKLHNFLSG